MKSYGFGMPKDASERARQREERLVRVTRQAANLLLSTIFEKGAVEREQLIGVIEPLAEELRPHEPPEAYEDLADRLINALILEECVMFVGNTAYLTDRGVIAALRVAELVKRTP